jgi:predicted NBD/HSP70 family sugar kinase/predicted transcriptional regulator
MSKINLPECKTMSINNNVGDQKGTKISIIQALRINGAVSRIELSRLTKLSRATISQTITELIDAQLVQETDSRHSTGGRPATLLELKPYSNMIIGADYSDQHLTLGAFDLLGNVIQEKVIPVNNNAPESMIQTLAANMESFISKLDSKPIELIGLGLPGLANINRGYIMSSPSFPGWNDVDITGGVLKAIGWQAVVLNRHRARGLAECRFGAGKEYNESIYIGIGSGIAAGVAAGIFSNRQLVLGATGGAGEIGHLTVEPDGPLCPCGNFGCMEQLATGTAMERDIRVLLRSGRLSSINNNNQNNLLDINAEMIAKHADAGDPLCKEVVEKAAGYLGIVMANLVNIINPEAIILGGAIPSYSSHYVTTATQVMHQRAMGSLAANVVVKTSSYKEIGGALGAANFALDQHMSYSLFKHSFS